MKIIFIGAFPSSYPIFSYLLNTQKLEAVFVLETITPREDQEIIKKQLKKQNKNKALFVVSKSQLNSSLKQYLSKYKNDLVLVNYCAVKIHTEVLNLPKYGFLNIHPGKLPENRGANPIFWTIKNKEKSTAITIHKMDANFDTGDVLTTQIVPVQLGETSGMLHSKMALLSVDVLKEALTLVSNKKHYKPQYELDRYQHKPKPSDLIINWEAHTAEEIECLVNACNPIFNGATTYYQKAAIQLLEVAPVDQASPMFGYAPGEIIHAHPQQGLFVYCKYGTLLKINILKSDAGVLTGNKYVVMGMQKGQRFNTHKSEKQLTIK